MADSLPDGDAGHSYFIPMVDMLAGVVFVLVILLASMNLIQRDDFVQVTQAEEELARMNAALEAARAQVQKVVEPRRRADAALKRLLENLRTDLAAKGVAARTDPVAGRLVLEEDGLFAPGGAGLSERGRTVAEALAAALRREMPCLADAGATGGADCSTYDGQKLKQASLAVPQAAKGDGAGRDLAAARPLALLSEVVTRQTALAGLNAGDGGRLLTNSSFAGAEPAAGADGRPFLDFQMQIGGPG